MFKVSNNLAENIENFKKASSLANSTRKDIGHVFKATCDELFQAIGSTCDNEPDNSNQNFYGLELDF